MLTSGFIRPQPYGSAYAAPRSREFRPLLIRLRRSAKRSRRGSGHIGCTRRSSLQQHDLLRCRQHNMALRRDTLRPTLCRMARISADCDYRQAAEPTYDPTASPVLRARQPACKGVSFPRISAAAACNWRTKPRRSCVTGNRTACSSPFPFASLAIRDILSPALGGRPDARRGSGLEDLRSGGVNTD